MLRLLTEGEREIAQSIFGDALDLSNVTVQRRKWFPFQPRDILMAPCGHVHVHPGSEKWSEDYSREKLGLQGLLIHELTHVLQTQRGGKYYLPLMRHPFCRYNYTVRAGWRWERYGLEQQAEIVRHVFLLRRGYQPLGAASLTTLESILPFRSFG